MRLDPLLTLFGDVSPHELPELLLGAVRLGEDPALAILRRGELAFRILVPSGLGSAILLALLLAVALRVLLRSAHDSFLSLRLLAGGFGFGVDDDEAHRAGAKLLAWRPDDDFFTARRQLFTFHFFLPCPAPSFIKVR